MATEYKPEWITRIKLDLYREYLEALDVEFLLYEFNDRMGCDPGDYFMGARVAIDRNAWEENLLDHYAVVLMDDLTAIFINPAYLRGELKINRLASGGQ